jgi:CubicO group peptidase (beta-lactamase class C family)
MRLFLFLTIYIYTLNILSAQTLYFPPRNNADWERLDPSSLNWCQFKIDEFYHYLDSTNSKAFILLKDGKIVLEKYFDNFTKDSFHLWNSAGKTLTGFGIGIAQQEGSLNINEVSSKYLGNGWSSCTPEQEQKITIKNHLSMTTGLDDSVANSDCSEPTCLIYKADAGTRWAYHNGPYTILDKVIANATQLSLNAFINNRIMSPIGGAGLYYKFGNNNVYISNTYTMARFGLLLLATGRWNNTIIMRDSVYLNSMLNSSQSINPAYGYLTWLNGKSSYKLPGLQFQFQGYLNPDAPEDVFAALGKDGQIINVSPSKNIVFVRIGDAPDVSNFVPNIYNNTIWNKILNLACPSALDEESIDFDNLLYYNHQDKKLLINKHSQIKIEEISLFNINGNILKTYKLTQFSEYIDLSYLRSDIYFVNYKSKNLNKTQKISVTD